MKKVNDIKLVRNREHHDIINGKTYDRTMLVVLIDGVDGVGITIDDVQTTKSMAGAFRILADKLDAV